MSRVFTAFDVNGSGSVTLLEFLRGLWACCVVKHQNLSALAFRIYNAGNQDGFLTPVGMESVMEYVFGASWQQMSAAAGIMKAVRQAPPMDVIAFSKFTAGE